MIIVDRALKKRQEENRPIQVALIGAGFMGRGIARQICLSTPGMELAVLANRHLSGAQAAYREAGIEDTREVTTLRQLEEAMACGMPAVTEDALLACQAANIDAVVEATGQIEFAARVCLEAFSHGKHVILMNAELDATLGPILNHYAQKAGVVFSESDGDQPGVLMNLYRFVTCTGCRPVMAGNMKGLQDPYRTPLTQKNYAAQYHLAPEMATAFADGTKVSMEMAAVANGTGFRVGRRGMYGPRCDHINNSARLFPLEQMLNGGLVDYILGAQPAPGVFILGHSEDPLQQHYLNYYKMGSGPLYAFYRPYHLCHLETPSSIARAVLFHDPVLAPDKGHVCDVIIAAKRDLREGETLDGLGGFTYYGLAENADVSFRERLLPAGLAKGCVLKHDIAMDQVVGLEDVILPPERLCDRLRAEQDNLFHRSLRI
jgi:predicted homoserine dehydrogenase-like protein